MSNIALFQKVRDQIANDPKYHDQWSWGTTTECGTVCCAGGWACILHGYKPIWESYTTPEGKEAQFFWLVNDPEGEEHDVENAAKEALDLTMEDADILFFAEATWQDTLDKLDTLIQGKHLDWADWEYEPVEIDA